MRWLALAAVVWALAWNAEARTVGFEALSVPVPRDQPLRVGIWYPAQAPESPQRLGLGVQSVAAGASVSGRGLPLVVMSHGTGGSFADHHDTARALAQAGFVVAAVSHTGDTYADRSRAARIGERPPHIGLVIDHMTARWSQRAALDPQRIGVFGFSAGGFTALVAVGGRPDLGRIAPHCAAHADYFDCGIVRQFGGGPPTELRPTAHDRRIRAAVIAAPALGFTFAPDGLADVQVPIQLWRGEADRILPHPLYAEAVRTALPRPPDYRVVPGADHFDFLPPCSSDLAKAVPQICVEAIDRTAFHARFNADVVAFFQRNLR